MSNYKTYRKEKWLYFILSIAAYFLPVVIVTAFLLPMTEAATGVKWGMGMAVVLINSLLFLWGAFHAFTAHFPMLNIVAILFLALAAFFTLDFFQKYVGIFCWIEFAAVIGSIASCIFWGKFRKYSGWSESVKAIARSGILKGGDNK